MTMEKCLCPNFQMDEPQREVSTKTQGVLWLRISHFLIVWNCQKCFPSNLLLYTHTHVDPSSGTFLTLTGCIVHGMGLYLYTSDEGMPGGSNWTLECVPWLKNNLRGNVFWRFLFPPFVANLPCHVPRWWSLSTTPGHGEGLPTRRCPGSFKLRILFQLFTSG